MIAVIFDKKIRSGRREKFDEANATLLRLMHKVHGLVSVEQFSSTDDRVVSIAFFRDSAAVKDWREDPEHQEFQRRLREEVLADYRMVVAPVERDYGMFKRAEAVQELADPAEIAKH